MIYLTTDSDDENDPAFSLVELEEEELPPDVTEQEDAAPLRAGGVRRQDAAPWRIVGDDASPKDHPEWLGSIPLAEELRQPVEYFRDFFDDEFLKFIVTQSNLYATQQNVNKPLKLDKDELEQFLGTVFLMSLFKISNTRLYWSGVLEFDSVSKVFSRRRWEEIKSSLHFNDNTQAPDRTGPNADRLFKVRPLLDHLQSKFRSIPMQQICCIDEMIVPFKGNSYLKQYIPSKPHKWGFKVFALCDTSGILNDFHVYDGPLKPVQGEPDLGPSSNIVLQLARTIPVNANHLLYHDNWFTSPKLMAHLATKQIYSLGTVRQNRLKGIGNVLPTDKEMLKKQRGSHVEVSTTYDGVELRAMKWVDNRCVTLLTSFSSAQPLGTCKRYDKKRKEIVEIPCPKIVKTYNEEMGRVDLLDSLIALYRIHIRSHKYYHKLVFHFLDVTIVNSWLLYRRDASAIGVSKKSQLQLQAFKLKVAYSLLRQNKDPLKRPGVGRPRSSSLETEHEEKKKRGHATKPIPSVDITKDGIGHWPKIVETKERPRCKLPNCKGRPNTYCCKCNVALCLNKERNCFIEFHTK